MHEARLVLTALALLAAMVLVERVARRERLAAVALVLLSLAWFTVDHDVEIAVLVRVTHGSGLTVADLAGIAGVLRGGWLFFRPAGRRTANGQRRRG